MNINFFTSILSFRVLLTLSSLSSLSYSPTYLFITSLCYPHCTLVGSACTNVMSISTHLVYYLTKMLVNTHPSTAFIFTYMFDNWHMFEYTLSLNSSPWRLEWSNIPILAKTLELNTLINGSLIWIITMNTLISS